MAAGSTALRRILNWELSTTALLSVWSWLGSLAFPALYIAAELVVTTSATNPVSIPSVPDDAGVVVAGCTV